MNVCDIMRADAPSIHQKASVQEAVDLMHAAQLSGLPVVDDHGLLVGIVTEHDVIKALMPKYNQVITDEATWPDFNFLLESRARELRLRPVSDIMVRNVVTTSADDPIIRIASTMLIKRIKMLPVVENGKPIGVINRIDLAHSLIG